MRPLQRFERYPCIRSITPNIPRAQSLLEESKRRLDFLKRMQKSIDVDAESSHIYIEISYDILIAMSRALMFCDGFHASGEGAHEAEVAFLVTKGIAEKTVRQ